MYPFFVPILILIVVLYIFDRIVSVVPSSSLFLHYLCLLFSGLATYQTHKNVIPIENKITLLEKNPHPLKNKNYCYTVDLHSLHYTVPPYFKTNGQPRSR